jgi:hypothetical protein
MGHIPAVWPIDIVTCSTASNRLIATAIVTDTRPWRRLLAAKAKPVSG